MDKIKHEIKKAINRFVRHKGSFPTLQEVCNALNFSSDQAKKYMEALAADGYVEKINDWYRFPEDKKEVVINKEREKVKDKPIIIDTSLGKAEETIIEDKIIYPVPVETVNIPLKGAEIGGLGKITVNLDEKLEEAKDDPIEIPIKETKKFKLGKSKIKEFSENFKKKINKGSNTNKNDMSLAVYVIKWSMLIVGIGSIIVSIFYNIRLSLEFLPGILAIIAGCIFVLFSVISFEIILLFISFRKIAYWKKAISIFGFIILWLIVATFSISATVSGRYERYMLNQQDQSGEHRIVNAGKLKWKNLQEKKQDLIHRINEKRNQISQFNKIASKIEDIGTREDHGTTFTDTQWRISQAEKDLDRYSQSLERLREEETKQLETNPEMTAADERSGSYANFYEWLSTIFGTPKEKIHFFLSLMPAFFFDIVSPIAIAIFLFLKKE